MVTVTDNFPLELGLEAGIVGIVAFGWLIWVGLQLIRKRRDDIGTALYGMAVAILATVPVYETFRLFPLALLYWLFVGLATSSATGRNGHHDSARMADQALYRSSPPR